MKQSCLQPKIDELYRQQQKKYALKKYRENQTDYLDMEKTHLIVATRFNHDTASENKTGRGEGCLYGNPSPLKKYQQKNLLVLEMNIQTNQIMGIGLIKHNCLIRDINARNIYENTDYNHYVFKSSYRIDRSEIDEQGEMVFQKMDTCCFRGTTHIKRGRSISMFPVLHVLHIEQELGIQLVPFIRGLFASKYK